MNLEKNIDQNIITYTITLEPEEYRKYKYQAYLDNRKNFITKNMLRPNYQDILAMVPEDYFDHSTVKEVEPVLFDLIEKESDETIVEPTIIDVKEEDDNIVVTVLALQKPEIELIDYKNVLTRPQEDFDITEEELNEELNRLVKTNARLESSEEPLAKGNQADITLSIYDSSDLERPIVGGESQMIDFDDQGLVELANNFNEYIANSILGANVGDRVQFPLDETTSFENVESMDITGAPRILEFTVNQIYVPDYPELDDDFAAEISEFDTLDEFKEDLTNQLVENKKERYWSEIDKNNIDLIFEGVNVDLPEIYQTVTESNSVNQYTNYMRSLNPDSVYLYAGLDNYFKDLVNEELVFQVMRQLAEAEELAATEEEIEELKAKLDSVSVKDKYLGYDLSLLQDLFRDFPRISQKDIDEFYEYMILRDKVKNKLREYTQITEETTEE